MRDTKNNGRVALNKKAPSDHLNDEDNENATHIFASQLHVMTTWFLRESINTRVVFARSSKRIPNVSTQHKFRLSCSVYVFNHVDLYHGLQRVYSCYLRDFSSFDKMLVHLKLQTCFVLLGP